MHCMDLFDRLRMMKTRTYFLLFGPPTVVVFVVIFSHCLVTYGDICYKIIWGI